jgi:hypothetical protein
MGSDQNMPSIRIALDDFFVVAINVTDPKALEQALLLNDGAALLANRQTLGDMLTQAGFKLNA